MAVWWLTVILVLGSAGYAFCRIGVLVIDWGMKVTQLYSVRHLLTATCSLIGVALLAIGANAVLDPAHLGSRKCGVRPGNTPALSSSRSS